MPLDLTGDGQRESVGYDTTGDGRVDALDTNGDGALDARIVAAAKVPPASESSTSAEARAATPHAT